MKQSKESNGDRKPEHKLKQDNGYSLAQRFANSFFFVIETKWKL